jgi:CTP synthase (UTP-ammonia lyase)
MIVRWAVGISWLAVGGCIARHVKKRSTASATAGRIVQAISEERRGMAIAAPVSGDPDMGDRMADTIRATCATAQQATAIQKIAPVTVGDIRET